MGPRSARLAIYPLPALRDEMSFGIQARMSWAKPLNVNMTASYPMVHLLNKDSFMIWQLLKGVMKLHTTKMTANVRQSSSQRE